MNGGGGGSGVEWGWAGGSRFSCVDVNGGDALHNYYDGNAAADDDHVHDDVAFVLRYHVLLQVWSKRRGQPGAVGLTMSRR